MDGLGGRRSLPPHRACLGDVGPGAPPVGRLTRPDTRGADLVQRAGQNRSRFGANGCSGSGVVRYAGWDGPCLRTTGHLADESAWSGSIAAAIAGGSVSRSANPCRRRHDGGSHAGLGPRSGTVCRAGRRWQPGKGCPEDPALSGRSGRSRFRQRRSGRHRKRPGPGGPREG